MDHGESRGTETLMIAAREESHASQSRAIHSFLSRGNHRFPKIPTRGGWRVGVRHTGTCSTNSRPPTVITGAWESGGSIEVTSHLLRTEGSRSGGRGQRMILTSWMKSSLMTSEVLSI